MFSYREKERKREDLQSEKEKYLARRAADAGTYTQICNKLDDRLLASTAASNHAFDERHVTDAENHQALLAYGRPGTRASLIEQREAFEGQMVAHQKPGTIPDEVRMNFENFFPYVIEKGLF